MKKNEINKTQAQPVPVDEVVVHDLNAFLEWLGSEDREAELSLSFMDNLYHFRTRSERMQWVLGFQAAWEWFDEK